MARVDPLFSKSLGAIDRIEGMTSFAGIRRPDCCRLCR